MLVAWYSFNTVSNAVANSFIQFDDYTAQIHSPNSAIIRGQNPYYNYLQSDSKTHKALQKYKVLRERQHCLRKEVDTFRERS